MAINFQTKNDIYEIIKTKKRINIIGPPGSGKTNLCKDISKNTQINLIELDAILFDVNCNVLKNKSEVLLKAIESNSPCIIDGTYFSLMSQERIELIDQFIMIKVNFLRAFFGILKRTYKSKACTCGEKLNFSLIKFLFSYYFYKGNRLKKIIPNKKLIICKI